MGPRCTQVNERVHYKFCKYQLEVGSQTANPAVLGECGRDRIHVACYVKCIKFWLKIITSLENSLLRSCYRRLCRQIERGKINWASKVKAYTVFLWIWGTLGEPGSNKSCSFYTSFYATSTRL